MNNNYFYAQIDSNNICYVISNLSGEVKSNDMIRLSEYDISLLGKKYDNGKWIEIEETKEEIPLSDMEQTIQETAVNTEYLVALADLGL